MNKEQQRLCNSAKQDLFASRESMQEAVNYVIAAAKATGPEVMTAAYVLLNTFINEMNKAETQ